MELLTTTEVAELLKVNRRTIYKLIDRGMPVIRVLDDYRFNKPDIEEWLKAQSVGVANA